MAKLHRETTANGEDSWVDYEADGNRIEVARISFNNDHPFITKAFCDRVSKAVFDEIMEEIRKRNLGEDYDRNSTLFDRRAAERVASKIIEGMKRGC